jgi:hypothetical protein
MAREQLTDHISIDFGHNNPEWNRIRHAQQLREELDARGRQWVERLNADLRSAQSARNQPLEDGYTYNITTEGSRDRLYVWPSPLGQSPMRR